MYKPFRSFLFIRWDTLKQLIHVFIFLIEVNSSQVLAPQSHILSQKCVEATRGQPSGKCCHLTHRENSSSRNRLLSSPWESWSVWSRAYLFFWNKEETVVFGTKRPHCGRKSWLRDKDLQHKARCREVEIWIIFLECWHQFLSITKSQETLPGSGEELCLGSRSQWVVILSSLSHRGQCLPTTCTDWREPRSLLRKTGTCVSQQNEEKS